MPHSKADKREEMSGEQVRLGVWMKIDLLAVLRMCRMKVLSGVGGGVGVEKGWRIRFAWWGEGRRMVCIGGVSWGKEICLIRGESKGPFATIGFDEVVSEGNEGSPVPSLAQNASQKS